MQLSDKFWQKVDKDADAGNGSGCWYWTGSLSSKGYGIAFFQGKYRRAHRLAFIEAKGQVPDGLVIDHVCRNRRCVRPSHMEAVTNWVNTLRGDNHYGVNARKTHCVNGHPLVPGNLRPGRAGRECLTCRNAGKRASARRRRLAMA